MSNGRHVDRLADVPTHVPEGVPIQVDFTDDPTAADGQDDDAQR